MKKYIYSLICPISNQIKYIGQTKRDLKKRLQSHIWEYTLHKKKVKFNTHKFNWMAKVDSLGLIPNIKIELIEECDSSDINVREIFWIDYYNHLNLVNVSLGGGGHSDETIQKIKESKIGPKNPMYGRKVPKEQRAKMVDGMRKSPKFKASRQSQEYKTKISKALSVPLVVINEDGSYYGEFPNARECGEHFGFKKANILHAVKDKRLIGKSLQSKFRVIRKDEYTPDQTTIP